MRRGRGAPVMGNSTLVVAALDTQVSGKNDRIRARTEKVRETPEQKQARERAELAERKKKEAEQERLEMGDIGGGMCKYTQANPFCS